MQTSILQYEQSVIRTGSSDDDTDLYASIPHAPRSPATLDVGPGMDTSWGGAICLADLLAQPELLREPRVIVPGLCAEGHLTLLAAAAKLGKSTVASFIAARISAGNDMWGGETEPGRVLWCSFDESLRGIVRRLQSFDADIHQVGIRRDWSGVRMQDRAAEIRRMAVASQPALIVIDTLSTYSDGLVSDEKDSTQMTRVLQPLRDLCHELGIAMLMLHHSNRANGTYRGSSAIAATVDAVVEMHEVPGRRCGRKLACLGRWTMEDFTIDYDEAQRHFTRLDGQEPRKRAGASTEGDRDTRPRRRMYEAMMHDPMAQKSAIVAQAGIRRERALQLFDVMVAEGSIAVTVSGGRTSYRAVAGREAPA